MADIISGPFTQTKFLGATVGNFQTNIGWNDQQSGITISLYEDQAADDDFILKDSNVQNNFGQLIGTPVSFQFGSFTFTGLIQSYEEEDSFTQNPGYRVVLISPTKVLEATQVIMSNYVGPTNDSVKSGVQQGSLTFNISNIFNLFGYLEDGGAEFGRSNINETGLLWNGTYGVKAALETLSNTTPPLNSVPTAYSNYGSYMLYRGNYYKLDLSGLPVPPDVYRIGGGTINWNLLDLINQFCQDGGVDYLVKLTLGNGNGPHTIAFNTVDRVLQPTLNQVASFLRNQTNINIDTKGHELRSDITQVMLVGGEINTLTMLQNDTNNLSIIPFWGFDADGNPIIGQKPDGTYYADDDYAMNLNASNIADIMGSIGYGLSYPSTILELRCALISFDAWATYIRFQKPDIATALNIYAGINPANITGSLLSVDLVNDGQQFAEQLSKSINSDYFINVSQKLYDFVKEQADTYYGKKFIVKLPTTIQIKVTDQGTTVLSNDVADAGFLPEGSSPLGLNYINENYFLDQTGRYYPFLRFSYINTFNSIYDQFTYQVNENTVSSAGAILQYTNNYNDRNLYIRADVGVDGPVLQDGLLSGGSQIIFVPSSIGVTVPAVVVNINNALFANAIDVLGNRFDLAQLIGVDPDVLTNILSRKNHPFPIKIHPPALYPNAAAVALKSNQYVYGPWGSFTTDGKVEFEQDESLVPWEYGGYDLMNEAAAAKIARVATGTQVLDRASVTSAGSPTSSLGDALVNGGPTITSISCTVDPTQGITTNYTMETFVNRVGAFSRDNAERLRRIGKVYQRLRRSIRQLVISKTDRGNLDSINYQGFLYGATYALQEKSPHSVLVGNLAYDSTKQGNFPLMSTQTYQESLLSIRSANPDVFPSVACMGMEGMFRPFTMDSGNLNLPYYIKPNRYPFSFASSALNPFVSNTDISWIVTGTGYIGMNSRIYNLDMNTARPVGLRGPMVLCGWGYDIDNNPVPNAGSTITIGTGIAPNFDDLLQNYNSNFFENYKVNSQHWPVGPIDLKWDKFRGMWAAPGMILAGCVTGTVILPGGTGDINIYVRNQPSNETIAVNNFFSNVNASLSVDQKVYIGYDPFNECWRVIAGDCPN